MYPPYLPRRSAQIWGLIGDGTDPINAKTVSLTDIVEGPVFAGIEASWHSASIAHGKLRTCGKACGQGLDPFCNQYR